MIAMLRGRNMASSAVTRTPAARDPGADHRPQRVGAVAQHPLADPGAPVGRAAPLLPPGQQPPGDVVQLVLAGHADGAVDLVGVGADLPRRPGRGHPGRGDLEGRVQVAGGELDGRDGRAEHGQLRLRRQLHQPLPDGLEAGDRPPELLALVRVADRQAGRPGARAGQQGGARQRPAQGQPLRGARRRRRHPAGGQGGTVEDQAVAGLAGQVAGRA